MEVDVEGAVRSTRLRSGTRNTVDAARGAHPGNTRASDIADGVRCRIRLLARGRPDGSDRIRSWSRPCPGLLPCVLVPLLGNAEHSAARIGPGSDVLGFDSERSTDHGWGPRAQLFVHPQEVAAVQATLAANLPETYRDGLSASAGNSVPARHHVEVSVLEPWLRTQLGFDPLPGA